MMKNIHNPQIFVWVGPPSKEDGSIDLALIRSASRRSKKNVVPDISKAKKI